METEQSLSPEVENFFELLRKKFLILHREIEESFKLLGPVSESETPTRETELEIHRHTFTCDDAIDQGDNLLPKVTLSQYNCNYAVFGPEKNDGNVSIKHEIHTSTNDVAGAAFPASSDGKNGDLDVASDNYGGGNQDFCIPQGPYNRSDDAKLSPAVTDDDPQVKHADISTWGIHVPPPSQDHVRIDIINGDNQITYKKWNEYINDQKGNKMKTDYSMIADSTMAISGQAFGAILANQLTNPSRPSWIENFVKFATLIGIVLTTAGIVLRIYKKKSGSGIMIKLGATAMASAIILSLGLSLPPILAGIAGLVSCLILAIAMAMA